MTAFGDIVPCNLFRSRPTFQSHHPDYRPVTTSETLVYFYETTGRNISVGCNFHTWRRDNLKFRSGKKLLPVSILAELSLLTELIYMRLINIDGSVWRCKKNQNMPTRNFRLLFKFHLNISYFRIRTGACAISMALWFVVYLTACNCTVEWQRVQDRVMNWNRMAVSSVKEHGFIAINVWET
jgi:hypothetical protein